MAELKKYAQAATVLFPLIDRDAVDFETGATFAAGDVKIIKDEGAAANTTNLPVHEGNGIYSLALTATELTAARVVVTVIDQTVPKVWEDQAVLVDTYGNASAEHAFDLDLAQQLVTVASMNADVVTAAAIAADAIGAVELAGDAVAEIVNAVWDELTAEGRVAGSYGQLVKDNVNASVSSRATPADVPTAAANADAVWDEAQSGHKAVGTFGRAGQAQHSGLAAGGDANTITLDVAAGPFVGSTVLITGGTGAGQARVISLDIGTIAVISPPWVTAPNGTSEFVILPCGSATMQGFSNSAADALADVFLKRPVSSVEPSAVARTLYGAVCALVNRARINPSGNLEVYKTDDATVLATMTGTADAALTPIKELDP
ncbi:MAG: hypothetical protein U1B78_07560 [Dehalococcoidia bacterium]|nr:hypothetical protein [Dehalococcoidia bacterium]